LKRPVGYKLSTKTTFLLPLKIQNDQSLEEEYTLLKTKKAKKRFYQSLQLRIPVMNNLDAIVNRLVGKWFADLRWLGLIKRETGFILQWSTSSKHNENNNLFDIQLRIVSEYIVIESNAISDADRVKAMSNVDRIITEMIKILGFVYSLVV